VSLRPPLLVVCPPWLAEDQPFGAAWDYALATSWAGRRGDSRSRESPARRPASRALVGGDRDEAPAAPPYENEYRTLYRQSIQMKQDEVEDP
jgi:hypothetical protein